jgi:hypothetical protein
MADNLPPSSADVTESGSLNLPEPSDPYRPVMDYFTFTFNYPNFAGERHFLNQDHCLNLVTDHFVLDTTS